MLARLAIALVVAGAVAGVAAPAAADATWSGKPGLVAYWGLDGVQTVRPDGSHHRLVLPGLTGNTFAWSPNGREIGYSIDGIWRARADGAHRRLVRGAGYEEPGLGDPDLLSPAWGPRGDRLVFTAASRTNTGDPPLFINWIWSVHRDGTHLRKLVRGKEAVWSRSGAHIRFIDEDDDIVQINADGSGQRVLAYNSNYTHSLDLSPDGQRLVYQTGAGRETTFQTLNVRNGARTKFSLGKLGVGDAVWAPGGKRLAYLFLPWRQKRYELRTVRPNGQGVRKVLTFPESNRVKDLAWQTR